MYHAPFVLEGLNCFQGTADVEWGNAGQSGLVHLQLEITCITTLRMILKEEIDKGLFLK